LVYRLSTLSSQSGEDAQRQNKQTGPYTQVATRLLGEEGGKNQHKKCKIRREVRRLHKASCIFKHGTRKKVKEGKSNDRGRSYRTGPGKPERSESDETKMRRDAQHRTSAYLKRDTKGGIEEEVRFAKACGLVGVSCS